MPIIKNMSIYNVNNNKNLAIILKHNSNKTLVWLSDQENKSNTQELSLIINHKVIFFSKDSIKEINNKDLKEPLINKENKKEYNLNFYEQNKVINGFERSIDQQDPNKKMLLLELKNESLTSKLEELKSSLNTSERRFVSLVNKYQVVKLENHVLTKKYEILAKEKVLAPKNKKSSKNDTKYENEGFEY